MVNMQNLNRRAATAVLVIAGLIGTVAGASTGYATRPTAQGPEPSASPGATNSPSSDPTSSGDPLFYFHDGKIHDGGQAVEVTLSRDLEVSTVQRVGTAGWLVVQLLSEGGEQEDYYGTYVDSSGPTWDLGRVGLTWDITPDGKVLFSPEPWSFQAANPDTGQLETLDIIDGPGEDLPYMLTDNPPAPWLLWGGSGVLTGWDTPDGSQMVLTETDGYTHTEVAPLGIYRPNTSADGRMVVGSIAPGEGDPSCLTGGVLEKKKRWENCDYMRWSYSSPFSPNDALLIVLDTHLEGPGPTELMILNSRTGKRESVLQLPDEVVYDAAWADDRTLTVLTHPDADDVETTIIYRYDLDGTSEEIKRIQGTAALGEA